MTPAGTDSPAGFCGLIHGLVLASEVALPIPPIETSRPDVTYRIALGTPLPASSHRRSDDPDAPWAVEHWLDGRLAVDFPHRATFELSRAEVVLTCDHTGDSDLVAHLLLDHVMPRVIALRGDLMLHAAGAVAPSGRAYLFLGETGAGKSTLVTGLVMRGWALLDDDGIRVTDVDGRISAFPGAPGVRLLPDSAAAVLPEVLPGQPISHGNPKRRFPLDADHIRIAAAAAPIAGVFLLERSSASEATAETLGLAESIGAITEHGFHLADEPAAITRQAFERASALAAAAPVSRITFPTDLAELDTVRAFLDRLDAR